LEKSLASRDGYEVINSFIFNNQTFKHNINLLIWNRHLNKKKQKTNVDDNMVNLQLKKRVDVITINLLKII